MRKILITIILTFLTLTFGIPAFAITADDLVPRPNTDGEGSAELDATGDLPKVDLPSFFTTLIKTILGWAMLIAMAAIVVAAIYYLKSRGKEEDITKAKDIILYLVIGMAIMAAAYAIVAGILKFEFFE